MLPGYLKFCLRIGTPVRDWYMLEDSLLERYEKKIEEKGEAVAKQWARSEANWFLIELVKRLLNPLTWITVARSWFG